MNEVAQLPGRITALADPQTQPTSSEAGTIDVFLVLRRQKWPLILGAIIGLAAGILHYASSPKTYYSASTVLVHDQSSAPQEQLTSSVPVLRDETAVLNELQILRSLILAERVVEKLELHNSPTFLAPPVSFAHQALSDVKTEIKSWLPALESASIVNQAAPDADRIQAAALVLQRDIGLKRVGRTFAIEISVVLSDPLLSTEIVNTYAQVYLEDRQIANLSAADRSAEWLKAHIEEVRQGANVAAAEAEAFRAANGASNNQALRQLEQRAVTLNELHAVLLARLEMIAVEGTFPATNGRLLSAAITPKDPALPKGWRLLTVGLVFGLMLGLTIAVLRELRESAFRSGEDIRRQTGLPFLGYLPRFHNNRLSHLSARFTRSLKKNSRPFGLWRRLQKTSEPIETEDRVAISGCAPSFLLPLISPDALYCETIKNVLATFGLKSQPSKCQVVAIGSLSHGEGRSTVAANIAQSASLEGKRVLAIDADLQNPELSRQFGFQNEVGLHDVLDGKVGLDDALFHLNETGLKILPGRVDSERRQSAGLAKLTHLLEQARKRFDIIVIDFQPLGVSSDIKTVLPHIDGIVWVADWGRTSIPAFSQFTETEPQLKAKTWGVLLNRTVTRKLPLFGVAGTVTQHKRHPGFA